MSMQIKGIEAQFAGKECPECHEPWDVGDLIDKFPSGKRGHAQCVAAYVAVHGGGNGRSREPAAETYRPSTQARNGNGHGADVTPIREANPDLARFETAEQYWDASEAMTGFAKAAMKAANAFQRLAQQIDPHHAKDRTPRE